MNERLVYLEDEHLEGIFYFHQGDNYGVVLKKAAEYGGKALTMREFFLRIKPLSEC